MALFNEFLDADLATPYAHESKIFEDALGRQRYLDGLTFPTMEAAESETNRHLNALDNQAAEYGLLRSSVRIYSGKLVLSTIERDLKTGIRTAAPVPVVPPHDFDDPSLLGSFFGFTEVIPAERDEYGDPINIRPKLCYIVQHAGNALLPNITGQLSSFAPVTDARLEFLMDKQRNDTLRALDTLASRGNDLTERAARHILFLTRDSTALYQQAPRVGRYVRSLLNHHGKQVSEGEKFALLDLIQARFGTYEGRQYQIDAKAAFRRDGSGIANGQVISPWQTIRHVDTVTYGPSLNLRTLEVPTEAIPCSPTIAFATSPSTGNYGSIIQVPLEMLTKLKPMV